MAKLAVPAKKDWEMLSFSTLFGAIFFTWIVTYMHGERKIMRLQHGRIFELERDLAKVTAALNSASDELLKIELEKEGLWPFEVLDDPEDNNQVV